MDPIELALIALYRALDPDGFPVDQLGIASDFERMLDPAVSLPELTEAVDRNTRRGRYAASLAYVLGARFLEAGNDIDAQLAPLGARIIGRFGDADSSGEREAALRDAVLGLLPNGEITPDVTKALSIAFSGKVEFSFTADTGTWSFQGPAAEAATMLCELASMGTNCQTRPGRVRVGGALLDVIVIECEVCTQAPWSRTMVGVDPRNWPVYNPAFFQDVDVLTSAPAAGASWSGVIQESVGALVTGKPIITNLIVSYFQDTGVAVTAYDLAADAAVPQHPDDGSVKVDYGFFSVTDEGVHRRIRLLKVLHIDPLPKPWWMKPLWADQLLMIGWWF